MADKKEKPLDFKKGEIENKDFIRCQQTKCGFYLNGQCRKCDDCASPPFVLRKGCTRCRDCAEIENALRWDDPKTGQLSEAELEKRILEATIKAATERLNELNQGKETPPKATVVVRRAENAKATNSYIF